jgi:hypothetical protein
MNETLGQMLLRARMCVVCGAVCDEAEQARGAVLDWTSAHPLWYCSAHVINDDTHHVTVSFIL